MQDMNDAKIKFIYFVIHMLWIIALTYRLYDIVYELQPLPIPSIISIDTTPRDNKIAQAPILYLLMSLKSIYLRRSKTWKSLYVRKDKRPTASVNARKLVIIWIQTKDENFTNSPNQNTRRFFFVYWTGKFQVIR